MEEHCFNCCHFPVCDINKRAREAKIWEGDPNDFYKKEACSCDFYTPICCGISESGKEYKGTA